MQFQILALFALAGLAAAAPAAEIEARGDKSYSCEGGCSSVPFGTSVRMGNTLDALNGPFKPGVDLTCLNNVCARVSRQATTQELEAAVLKLENKCGSGGFPKQCGKAALDGKDIANGYLEFKSTVIGG